MVGANRGWRNVTHRQRRILVQVAKIGQWVRRTRIEGATRNVLLPLVKAGYVSKNERRRYRITGKGLEALE
jgi:predicted transcriptional regulator